jgi:hypothetical protein
MSTICALKRNKWSLSKWSIAAFHFALFKFRHATFILEIYLNGEIPGASVIRCSIEW